MDIAVVGPPMVHGMEKNAASARARITAYSRDGKVSVNLFELHESRHVDLDVSTRDSTIAVMLPPTFQGTLHLHQRHGNVKLLPAFNARTNVIRKHDRDVFMVVGNANANSADESIDRCFIGTRDGKVTIGLSGVDGI